jgi:hypothetical protein
VLKDGVIRSLIYGINRSPQEKSLAIVPIEGKGHKQGESKVAKESAERLNSNRRVLNLLDGLVQEGLVDPKENGIIEYKKDENGEHIYKEKKRA